MLLLVLGIVLFIGLVILHEMGHFFVARRNGVKVEEFGIFFPPRLYKKKTKEGWDFTINLLPLGGFVKLKGEHDADKEEGTFGAASDKANEATSKYNALESELKSDKGILQGIAQVQIEAKADLQKALDLHELYLTATGQLNGAPHIDFEVYYQAQLFDEILDSASKKLNDMTDGRYVFARRKAPLSGVGQFGLEIDVIDFNSGKERPVSTLSGGESFMASLALALSLSEIIQQKAGGIELDSMFVDEGFGTLDPESLDNAIRILSNLSNNGHRLVGIISHVEALQSSIPLQIVVNKGKEGSTIKLVA